MSRILTLHFTSADGTLNLPEDILISSYQLTLKMVNVVGSPFLSVEIPPICELNETNLESNGIAVFEGTYCPDITFYVNSCEINKNTEFHIRNPIDGSIPTFESVTLVFYHE